jgi:hypothetical protein
VAETREPFGTLDDKSVYLKQSDAALQQAINHVLHNRREEPSLALTRHDDCVINGSGSMH